MSLRKVEITIKGIKDEKETVIHVCKWDGDLEDWIGDIGGEFGAAIMEYDEVTMSAKPVKKGKK